MPDPRQQGVMFALGSAVLFGLSTPLAKLLVGSVAPLALAGLLYLGSGLGLALALLVRGAGVSATRVSFPRRGEWLWLAGAVLFGGIAGPVALMYGLLQSSASTASLLLNLEAVFTALLAWFVFHENLNRRVALGMSAIIAGGLVLAWTPQAQAAASTGEALVALACLCWAVDNNLTRKVSANDATLIASIKGLAAGAVNLGLALVAGVALPAPSVLGAAMALGFLGYGLSLVLFVLALRHLGTARTGAYFSVAPFFGAALAMLVQGEPLTAQLLAAGTLMGVGVWLHLSERHGHLHRHEPQDHMHAHAHDEHHAHEHGPDWDGQEPHTHAHVHVPLVHAHAHNPDVHHRHPH